MTPFYRFPKQATQSYSEWLSFYHCDGNVPFSHALYNLHVFSESNRFLLHAFNSIVICGIFSLYIPFNRHSKVDFLRWYQNGQYRRLWLLDFHVKVRGVGSIGYMNDFNPVRSWAWSRSFWTLIKFLVIETRNKQGDPSSPHG